MKKIFLVLFSLAIFAGIGFSKKEPAPKVWSGYLMDKMCSKRMVGNKDKMSKHTKTCLTEEVCAASGYGIMSDKKFIPFDPKSNEMAANYLAATSRENDFQVEVTGAMRKNKIVVADIKEKK